MEGLVATDAGRRIRAFGLCERDWETGDWLQARRSRRLQRVLVVLCFYCFCCCCCCCCWVLLEVLPPPPAPPLLLLLLLLVLVILLVVVWTGLILSVIPVLGAQEGIGTLRAPLSLPGPACATAGSGGHTALIRKSSA